MLDDGATGERIEIVSTRDGVTVPLRAESDGIKKLVAILILLIDVYSQPGACVAVDELDSGIFEFLLGELLQVLEEHGRGQLIFTAHNLRPLETLDKTSLVFTTTNPNNRYVTFKGSKTTNNLRSQYLRAINLGGQPETIYEATSKFEIDSAFFDASNPED
jgi:AAA15 family ATPase/GTPase